MTFRTSVVLIVLLAAAGSAQAQTKDVNLLLECKTSPPQTATGSFPVAIASIPADDAKPGTGFVVTGGGCSAQQNSSNRFLDSRISDDGKSWLCRAGDFPGAREDSTIVATVRYCRISTGKP
jgi:hypothetical protein